MNPCLRRTCPGVRFDVAIGEEGVPALWSVLNRRLWRKHATSAFGSTLLSFHLRSVQPPEAPDPPFVAHCHLFLPRSGLHSLLLVILI